MGPELKKPCTEILWGIYNRYDYVWLLEGNSNYNNLVIIITITFQ